MLRPIRKVKKLKDWFSVNSQNLLYTIFFESTVLLGQAVYPIYSYSGQK